MNGSTFRVTVSLVLLSLGGILTFSALPEEVARKGHQILWVFEAAWFLREYRPRVRRLWASARFRTR
jgi:hypothetical protein